MTDQIRRKTGHLLMGDGESVRATHGEKEGS